MSDSDTESFCSAASEFSVKEEPEATASDERCSVARKFEVHNKKANQKKNVAAVFSKKMTFDSEETVTERKSGDPSENCIEEFIGEKTDEKIDLVRDAEIIAKRDVYETEDDGWEAWNDDSAEIAIDEHECQKTASVEKVTNSMNLQSKSLK